LHAKYVVAGVLGLHADLFKRNRISRISSSTNAKCKLDASFLPSSETSISLVLTSKMDILTWTLSWQELKSSF